MQKKKQMTVDTGHLRNNNKMKSKVIYSIVSQVFGLNSTQLHKNY